MLPLKGLHRKVFTQQDWWFSTTLWKVSPPSFPQPLYSSPSPRSCALGTLQITQGCIAAVSSGEGSFTILSPLWGNVGWQAQLGWSFASRHNWTPWGGNCLSQRIVSMSNNPSLLEFFYFRPSELRLAIKTQIACFPGRHFTNCAIFLGPWYVALSISLKIKRRENILLCSREVDKRNEVEKWARNFGKFQLSHSFMKG